MERDVQGMREQKWNRKVANNYGKRSSQAQLTMSSD